MDVAQLADSPESSRVSALGALGAALLTGGLCLGLAVVVSGISRPMHVESLHLGLDASTLSAVTGLTLADVGLLGFGGVLAVLGFAAVLAADRSPGRRS